MSHRRCRIGIHGACLALVCSTAVAAPARTNPPATLKDLSKVVEVIVSGRLRSESAGRARVGVSVWNPGKQPILGPLYLVVDGTGLEGVTLSDRAAMPSVGNGVYEIVPAGKLLTSHGMSPELQLVFTTPASLTREQADDFRLAARIFARLGEAVVSMEDQDQDFAVRGKSYDMARLNQVMSIQERHTPDLMKQPGVFATAVGENSKGDLVIRVNTETRAQAKALPGTIEGVEVEVNAIPGGYTASPARDTVTYVDGIAKNKATRDRERAEKLATISIDPTIYFDRPVPIGVSSINATDVCAAGTLGCRCIDASGKLYVLSNSHVYARESLASRGEPCVQPSQLDNTLFCDPQTADHLIANLVDFQSFNAQTALPTALNVMDCALSAVVDAVDPDGNTVPAVGFSTPANGYGTPSRHLLRTNRIGLQVQKYGRTTVYTRGYTFSMNVVSTVGYSAGPVDFIQQAEYRGILPNLLFGDHGDSGSLIVTLEDRRPVSLLFAGSGLTTLANPIGPVLDRYNVQVDDGERDEATTSGDYASVGGRQGIAIGNLGTHDSIYLPPELRGRIKNNKGGLIPIDPLTPAP